MPTLFRDKGFRFFFYSNEGHEPCHVHVIGRGGQTKIWIPGCQVVRVFGLNAKDLSEILAIVRGRVKEIERRWHEFFKSQK